MAENLYVSKEQITTKLTTRTLYKLYFVIMSTHLKNTYMFRKNVNS